MKDSLAFIRDTLAQYGKNYTDQFIYTPHSNKTYHWYSDSDKTTWYYSTISNGSNSNGCVFDLTNSSATKDFGEPDSTAVTNTISVFHLDLSSLDPSAIQSFDDSKVTVGPLDEYGHPAFSLSTQGSHISVIATNNVRAIAVMHDGKPESASVFQINVAAGNLGDRLVKALIHAVVLCGGKASSY